MGKTRFNLIWEEDPELSWNDFRAECIRRGTSASAVVASLVKEQMKKWKGGEKSAKPRKR